MPEEFLQLAEAFLVYFNFLAFVLTKVMVQIAVPVRLMGAERGSPWPLVQ